MSIVVEQATLLGPRKSMVGVISTSEACADHPDRPTIVILNSGIIHRVGTNRMTVALARALASCGHTVVRFDLSGIGDSAPRPDGLPPLEAELADIREVLDSLESMRRTRRFVLAGLCSGADFSIVYAGSDPRVVGLVLMDPTIPRTARYYLRYYGSRLTRFRPWISIFRGRHPIWKMLRERLGESSRRSASDQDPVDANGPDPDSPQVREFLARAYGSAIAGGLQIYAIFTAGIENRHNYRNQLIDAFPLVPFGTQLKLEYFRDSDHMFTSEAERERLIDLVRDWADQTIHTARDPDPAHQKSSAS